MQIKARIKLVVNRLYTYLLYVVAKVCNNLGIKKLIVFVLPDRLSLYPRSVLLIPILLSFVISLSV